MNHVNIRAIDLNLLVILHTVLEKKNTVAAAQLLGLSQPAVSHALNRLRDLFGDPLFTRAPKGLIPTPRALELAGPVNELIAATEKILMPPASFDPAKLKRTFRVATTDYFEQVALPGILNELARSAPGVTVITTSTQGILPVEALAADTDLAIAGFYTDIPDRFRKQKLFSDDFVCVTSGKLKSDKISVELYASRRHLAVSPQGDLKTRSREIMKGKGYEIGYAAGVSSFAATAAILESTDLLLTCPRRLAMSFARQFALKVYELPFSLQPIHINQIWHARLNEDPGHRWFRGLIHQVTASAQR